MVPLSFRIPREAARGVELQDQTVRPLIGELRIVSPLLAAKVEDAAISHNPVVESDEDEFAYVAAAANTLLKSALVRDPELAVLGDL